VPLAWITASDCKPKASARAILCNAGQANAATGAQGWLDVLKVMLLGQVLKIPAESIH